MKKRLIITEEERNHIKSLYESVVVTTPEENEWCKTNITDTNNQICIIKTPNSGNQSVCQTMTGNLARQKGFVNSIKIDVSEPNFCKSIWGKIN